jgi:DNA-binding IclR family transcriptional regulator
VKSRPARSAKRHGLHSRFAAAVFDHRSYPVASIWISGPSDRVTPGSLDKLGQKVKQFADQLSRQLGHQA